MICREFAVNEAHGIYLFNEVRLGTTVLPKGHVVDEADLLLFKRYGITSVFGAQMEDKDIAFPIALGIIAAKICGDNTAYTVGEDGICRIVSGIDGILNISEDRIAKFNRLNRHVVLNTVEPYGRVLNNEIIARLELTVPIIAQEEVDDILFRLSGNTSLLSVVDARLKKVGLIYSRFSGTADETRHFTAVVKKLVKDFPELQLEFKNEYDSGHSSEELANTLQRALKEDNDVVFILPGQRSTHENDVIMQGLSRFVDDIVCMSIPQVQASDLVIAVKKNKKVIVLPYNYDKAETAYMGRYIKQAVLSEKLNAFDFARLQNFIMAKHEELKPEHQGRLISSAPAEDGREHQTGVAAVVLAAGVGSRCGRNKLLVEKDGEPMFLKALNAAVKSKASPVFLITGYQADIMEEYVEDIDVNVLQNPGYRAGVRTSISLGLKSVPNFCGGAVIIPADMPNITPEHINKMIERFQKENGKSLIVSTYKGNKQNPVLWSKELFDNADIVPENADIRPVFMEHADYTHTVEIKNAEEIFDVNFPSDIESLTRGTENKGKK